jgi:hypothetical protein
MTFDHHFYQTFSQINLKTSFSLSAPPATEGNPQKAPKFFLFLPPLPRQPANHSGMDDYSANNVGEVKVG